MITIADKRISYKSPIFIIAEAGVNHNGSLTNALKLIDAAAAAGVDAVKFQTFKAEEVVTAQGAMADYQKKNIGKTESQLNMLKKLELNEKFYQPIIKHCRQKKIIFLSTPHGGEKSVYFLNSLRVPAFKFGSGDLTNLPLLRYAARYQKPMILGTGMSVLREIAEAVRVIKRAGNKKIIILHCTTAYPCPFSAVNLKAMQTMMREFKVLVGYSDHTLGVTVPVMAAALGACVIEKHFTLDKNLPGPDHKASLEPAELKRMVAAIRETEIAMGSAKKQPAEIEKKNKLIGRKSIVTVGGINKAMVIDKKMLAVKRPGTGIPPKFLNKIIGRKAKKNIAKDYLIKWSDIL